MIMKKILILTAGFGDGHNAAARSLRDAIEQLDEDARVEPVHYWQERLPLHVVNG